MKSSHFFEKIRNEHNVIIYGAGMVGGLVYQSLRRHKCGDHVIGFAVTRAIAGQTHYGQPVYCIEELQEYREESTVIIATLPGQHKEIARNLSRLCFTGILCVDEELYDALSQEYINAFLAEQDLGSSPIDVVCMASDNNSTSGAFLCMTDLLDELNKRGVRTLAVLPEYGSGENLLQDHGICYTYLPSEHWAISIETPDWDKKALRLQQNAQAVKELEALLRRHSVKLVHNNTSYTYIGAEAAGNAGLPVVWHLRENIREQGFEFVNPEMTAELINASSAVIAVSDYLSVCCQWLRRDKLHIVYDGVDVERYYLERDIFSGEKITIAAAGVLVPLKGQEDLVEAAKELKAEGIDFQIWFLGNGVPEYLDHLEELVETYELWDCIEFLGKQEKIEEFYQNADIAVVCSRGESFGRVTVEAQLAGCLVIGADAGATPELIEDGKTGLLYPKRIGAALKEKISWAVKERAQAREIARKGQRHAYKTFSKEQNARNIYKIYQEVVGEGIQPGRT